MWKIKGYPGHRLVKLTVLPFERQVTYCNALGDGDYDTRWIWTPTQAWKETADGTVITSRDNPRDSFEGHNLFTKWDDLHLLYFMGYAIWNYVCAPFYFTWPGMEVRKIRNALDDPVGAEWRALEVTYPDDMPNVHCKTQKYYVDDKYILRRLDYGAIVVNGPNAGGAAHMLFDHQDFDGILFPTLRRVIREPEGLIAGGPSLVLLSINHVAVIKRALRGCNR